jgi:hypothetical protein
MSHFVFQIPRLRLPWHPRGDCQPLEPGHCRGRVEAPAAGLSTRGRHLAAGDVERLHGEAGGAGAPHGAAGHHMPCSGKVRMMNDNRRCWRFGKKYLRKVCAIASVYERSDIMRQRATQDGLIIKELHLPMLGVDFPTREPLNLNTQK